MRRMQSNVLQNVDLVGYLHNLVCDHPDFEVLCEQQANLYCFRYMPNGLESDQRGVEQFLDRINGEIVESVRRHGFALITNRLVGGRIAIHISISPRTRREDVEMTFEAIARLGRLLTKKGSFSTYELKPDRESIQC